MGCGASVSENAHEAYAAPPPGVGGASDKCNTDEARCYDDMLQNYSESDEGSFTSERGTVSRWMWEKVVVVKAKIFHDIDSDVDQANLEEQSRLLITKVAQPAAAHRLAQWRRGVANAALPATAGEEYRTPADDPLSASAASINAAADATATPRGVTTKLSAVAISFRSGQSNSNDYTASKEHAAASFHGTTSDVESWKKISASPAHATSLHQNHSSMRLQRFGGVRLTSDVMEQHNSLMERSTCPDSEMPYDPSLLIEA